MLSAVSVLCFLSWWKGLHAARKRVATIELKSVQKQWPQMTLRGAPGGKCAKGDQAGYYYRAGRDGGENVWVFHFIGGGGCGDPISCASWADEKGHMGRFSPSKDGTLWRHPDPALNPTFWNAHHVEVAYCTGDGHGGQVIADDTIPIGNVTETRPWGNYHFRGHLNVEAIISHIHDTVPEFQNAARFLVTGQSAGGIGAFRNCEYLKKRVHELANNEVQVSCAADSGMYMPGVAEDNPDKRQPPTPMDLWLQGELKPEPEEVIDPQDIFKAENCLQMMALSPKPDEKLCASSYVIYLTTQVPFFIIQNQFDPSPMSGLGVAHSDAATQEGHDFIAYFGRAMKSSLDKVQNHPFGKITDGAFLASCYDHGSVGVVDGHTSVQALSSWWSGDGALPAVIMDQCVSEPPGLPCGQDCPHVPAVQEPCPATLTHRCGLATTMQTCLDCTDSFRTGIMRAGCKQEDVDNFCEMAGV